MTQTDVINKVFGSDWDGLDYEKQKVACRILDWMVGNFGLTGDSPTRDRSILAAIQIACIQVFGQNYEDIMVNKRNRERVDRRAMIYKVAREMSNSSDSTLSKYFPKSRATMFYHGINQANALLSVDREFRTEFVKFETAVKEIFHKNYEQSDNGN